MPQRPLTDGDGATTGEALVPRCAVCLQTLRRRINPYGRDHEPFHQPKDFVRES
jgi:hypothetical protein